MAGWNGICGGCKANIYRGEKCRCSPAARARRYKEMEDSQLRPRGYAGGRPMNRDIRECSSLSAQEILSLYKGGMSPNGLSDMVKSRNRLGTKGEARALVEAVIYEDMTGQAPPPAKNRDI